MQKRNIYLIILFISISVSMVIYIGWQYSGNVSTRTKVQLELKEKVKQQKVKLEKDKYQISKPLESNPIIEQFNTQLTQDFSYGDDSAQSAISVLRSKGDKDGSRESGEEVKNKILQYFENFAKNQIQIEEIGIFCAKLKSRIYRAEKGLSQINQQILDVFYNEYYFDIGLSDSKVCDVFGTKRDPFWMSLKLARQGNMMSQFLLLDNLWKATRKYRKAVNIYKDPIEYMQLRDEAIGYLKQLSVRGVHRASERLGRLYSGRGLELVPADPILTYYYFYLAKKQDRFELQPFDVNLDRFYNILTDKQKDIANRMTEGL